jgi:hypothetical protein
MNKDVIYIDVEDDITAIIGKVKATKEKIVALVPPKRIGVLQSAVNLRLLERAAKQSGKRLVLISNNTALGALAAAAKIPVAKNLQSKPEIAEISALEVDDEDIIDGSQLPVGEHARVAAGEKASSAVLGSLSIDDPLGDATKAAPPAAGSALAKPRVKSGIKVPNFNTFRKKLIFGIGGGILLVGFLVWAIAIAPRATVVITARTTESSANAKVTFSPTLNTDMVANTLKSTAMQSKKDVSVEFEATENKEVGEKAKGSITVRNCDYSTGFSLPAGTQFTAGSITFVSTAAVSVPGYSAPSSTLCSLSGSSSGKATVAVEASAIGDSFNVSARTYTVGTIPSGSKVDASGTDMAGGSKRQVKVVSSTDIQNAVDQLTKQNTDEIKKQLSDQFDKSYTVLDQTFKIDQGSPQSVPAKGQEVTSGSKAKLTTSVTYSLAGITKADIGKFLDSYFENQLKDISDQRTYSNGADQATFTNITAAADGGFTANLVATAKIGPKIDDKAIKDTAKGKRYGDVQSAIEAIQGVDNVDVKFWPFWVTGVPNDTNRIKVEFNLNESK